MFKHVLVRDAAYEGMAKSLRSGLHERFADALVKGDDGGDEQAGFVAHHLEQTARYRRELAGRDPEADALVERAVESLILAADHAHAREREDVSASYPARAMTLAPANDTVRRAILARRVVSCLEASMMDLLDEVLHCCETPSSRQPTAPPRPRRSSPQQQPWARSCTPPALSASRQPHCWPTPTP